MLSYRAFFSVLPRPRSTPSLNSIPRSSFAAQAPQRPPLSGPRPHPKTAPASASDIRPEVASFVEKLKASRSSSAAVRLSAGAELDSLSLRAWAQLPRSLLLTRINAAFSLAAFPVHVYGFWIGLNPWLLAWPALFSVCWLVYSVQRARHTITAIELVPGPNARFFTRSFFGKESAAVEVPLSAVHVLPQTEQQRKSGICYLDIYRKRASPTSKRESDRYVLEVNTGRVLDANAFNRIVR